jgi:hypothetical protein
MAKPNAKKWPKLAAYWAEYGHMIKWEQLFDMKVRDDGCYVVLAWKESNGKVSMADLARVSRGWPFPAPVAWEMQNDSFEPITPAQWKKLRIDAYCDSFSLPK